MRLENAIKVALGGKQTVVRCRQSEMEHTIKEISRLLCVRGIAYEIWNNEISLIEGGSIWITTQKQKQSRFERYVNSKVDGEWAGFLIESLKYMSYFNRHLRGKIGFWLQFPRAWLNYRQQIWNDWKRNRKGA